ncbi:MAG: 4-(cytidine 5'-diphospho)-2-C-methyl-D-erythritol kinase, partial [Bacteroidota bacterium]
AKINLGLHIVGKRIDGFHNIETVFHRIDLYDEINIENSDDISISCNDISIPTDGNNLCWKAVELLRKELGVGNGAKIEITKNIPTGAGLGGGSSDAAAMLLLLPELWKMKVERTVIVKMALRLGSDVPYFLQDSTAYAEGRGEVLNQLDLSLPYWIVVIHPNIHLSTPWAYQKLAEKRKGIFPDRPGMLDAYSDDPLRAVLNSENDFEEIVFEAHPKIKTIKTQLKECGAVLSLMSGSGSSMFGLFSDMNSAKIAAELFKKEHFVHMTEPFFTLRQ